MTVSSRGSQTLAKLTLIVGLFLAGATAACNIDSRTLTSAEAGSREAGADASVTAMKDGSHDGDANPAAPDGSDTGVVVPKVTVSIQRNGNGTLTGGGNTCTPVSSDVTVHAAAGSELQGSPR